MKLLIIIAIIFTTTFAKELKYIKNIVLLESMYQTFIYSNDLKNAYNIALEGSQKSNDLIWQTRLAQIAIWLNKYDEAYKILRKLYSKNKNNKEIEKKFLEISILIKNYDSSIEVLKEKSLKYHDKKDVDDLIYYFNLSGKPLEVAKILKDVYKKSNNPDYLTKAAQIYYNHSEIESAEEMLLLREKNHKLDLCSAKMLSLVYFDSRKVKNSLVVLKNFNGEKDSEYWKLLSDYSWVLRDFTTSLEAINKLFKNDNYREVDAERYLLLNSQIDKNIFNKIWKQYNNLNHLYIYLNNLAKNHKNQEIVKLIHSIDKKIFLKDDFILMSLVNAYIKLRQHQKAKEYIAKLVAINPNNPALWLQKIWVDIDLNDFNEVKKDLDYFKDVEGNLNENNLAISSGYMLLQDIDNAYHFFSKIKSQGFDRELELFYLNILSYNTHEEAINMLQKRIWEGLNKERDFNDKNFIINYIQIAMEFLEPKKFEELLEKYKEKLDEQSYLKILFLYNLKIENFDGNEEIFKSIENPEAWMELNMAISQNDIQKSLELIETKLPLLPYRDVINEATKANQISLAISLAFNSLNNSQKDYLVDREFRELILEYANFYQLISEYKINKTVSTNSFEFFNSYYMGNKIYFTQKLSTSIYSKEDNLVFKKSPSQNKGVEFGLMQLEDRGFNSINIGYKEALNSYFSLQAKINRKLNDKATIEVAVAKNEESRQNELLSIGAKQNSVTTYFNYAILNSLQWSNSVKYFQIYSSDDKKIADGVALNFAVSKVLKESFPKLQVDLFVDYSIYNKKGNSNGIIDSYLTNSNINLIPQDYCAGGVSIRYGNPLIQSKKFRPYGSFTTSINCNGSLNYTAQLGFTKQLFNDDFLNLYYLYDKNTNTNEESNNIHLDYKMLY